MARSGSQTSVSLAWARRIPATVWKLITQTVGTCLRYRVTGLAAEAAFFAILSLPPLIFGLAGSIGFIASRYFEVETIEDIKIQIADLAARALTDDSVRNVIVPTLDQVLDGGRPDVISIGFVLALWSGSRALNVFVDTITIMYGMGGKRGIIGTRALSFSLYCAALVIGVIVLPLVLAGPDAVNALLPERVDFLNQLYWPVVTILSAGFLNTLYHLSVPVRTPWVSDLPGSFLALSIWILGSFVLRWILQSTVGGTSIYGPLAAPIAVLMWLYMTAIAVLIGAALNAVVDRLWPHKSRKDHQEEVPEPAMKAETRREDLVSPGQQRPEIKVAEAVEGLGSSLETNTSEPTPAAASASPPAAPAASAPSAAPGPAAGPAPAPTAAPGPAATPAPAPTSAPGPATGAASRAAAGPSPAPKSGPVKAGPDAPRPVVPLDGAEADGKADGEAELGGERKPASVGKPSAPAKPDDLR